jgi:hypothetical protein
MSFELVVQRAIAKQAGQHKIKTMTVDQLKDALKKRGVSVQSNKKSDLMDSLLAKMLSIEVENSREQTKRNELALADAQNFTRSRLARLADGN